MFISSIGWLGLWFLGKQGAEIKVENSDFIVEADEFFNFGGATPKETLKLFIAALEKNDLILAVKYFIPENRETESEDLTKLYEIHLLGDLLKDLKSIKSGKGLDDGRYRFEVLDETGQAAAELELIKNQKGFWKIISL
ncbi:MAG: hypothetical protein UV48_C0002G0014 [Candidatus Azambacteria bacterium GW2011_GWA2_42_9]|uniref:DUF4878 domain-containing protein n=2 Tax=Candidatus Azamiibacteriota TaxID=1752741 RepID=A0A0G0ZCW2_9BACT|nr:MAG: hypothetical protein UV10_C0001G0022 [Candidatus Azambacteria bacterium GW2011_GWA1_42_19]KKS76071.1 MAG: hypothetical protein UV48_C0002G0014 [Candidatus Azambacteria bacterium GW2011_GWA2_42_9]